MNPSTQPQQNQDPSAQQTPQQDPVQGANQAKANLGFINTMQEHLLQYKHGAKGQNASQTPKTAPGEENVKETKDTPTEEKKEPDINETLTKFKTEIEGLMDSKLGDIKREIEMALAEDKSEDKTDEPPKTQ